jgi:ABC-type transport system involved in cytochrome bd biosynthesis fused ATPase/permease subunit
LAASLTRDLYLQTRILVTNSVTYLPKMDLIVVLRNGNISEMGTYTDLMGHKGAFADFITNYLLPDTNDPEGIFNLWFTI